MWLWFGLLVSGMRMGVLESGRVAVGVEIGRRCERGGPKQYRESSRGRLPRKELSPYAGEPPGL